jgi:hypothetical protein
MAFVNWQRVNAMYCGVMWTIALVLAVVILIQCVPRGAAPAHRTPAVAVVR